jgi:hypothetical protein
MDTLLCGREASCVFIPALRSCSLTAPCAAPCLPSSAGARSLRTHNDPQRCCEELVAEALRLHASDNVSLICCCFSADPPRRRVYACAKHLRGGSAARRPESGNSSPSPLAALLGSCEDGDAA